MALPLGKVAFLFGTGVVVSALAKESSAGDYLSGAFKILWRQLKQDNSKNSNPKPRSDALLQQVNSLREELQLLASNNRSITIVTPGGSGSSGRYGLIIVVVVVGYGYIWWKGWKLPDWMFATRRGLNDACSSVAKQLEGVYTSISETKKHLSSRINRLDSKVDDCADNTAAIREEVSEFRGEVRTLGNDLESVTFVVQNLETKISRIEGRQRETNFGLGKLIAYSRNLEKSKGVEQIEASASRSINTALEFPAATPTLLVESSSFSTVEPPSPFSSNGYEKRSLHRGLSTGAKIRHGISDVVGLIGGVSAHIQNTHSTTEGANPQNSNSTFGLSGRTLSANAAILTRSRGAVQTFNF
ncbi:unnamed protein product [Cuscuta epithymum]|uniref:DUF1664 domain-containing protein n=1 Tax=Cuscuta epithymum TaxID=186058 RepID=A0AAV0BXH5_9ASTE|nr:unnamed protein product [Cuscuta epithymum]